MLKITYTIIIIFFSYHSIAQVIEFPEFGNIRTGIINDADGFVNIRENNSTSSRIIGRIEKNEEFEFVFPKVENDKWALVKTSLEKIGYVYLNRIYDLRKKECINQIELISQDWDKINGWNGNRKIDSIAPNLYKTEIEISSNNQSEIDRFLSCGIENSDLFENKKTIKFTQKNYINNKEIQLVVSEYADPFDEMVGSVISWIENGEMISYLYNGNYETISIYAFEKVNGHYKLYGNLIGGPGDYYSGNFTLEFINKCWIYKFENYEFNG